VLPADQVATAETIVSQLLEHARQFGLHAPAPTAWPDDELTEDATPGERSIWQQLRIIQRQLRRLDPLHPRLEPLTALLLRSRRQGFRAPRTYEPPGIRPPRAVGMALARLRAITPHDLPLDAPRDGDTEDVSRDRRLVRWWLAEQQ